jgi:integrase
VPVIKISKRSVDALQPAEKPVIHYDEDLKGFGVLVTPAAAKSFVVEYRPHGGGRGSNKRRVTIGKTGTITAEKARSEASRILAEVRLGADPASAKAKQRAALTVGDLIDRFIDEHVERHIKASTAVSHKIALEALRRAHGGLKAEALSRGQLASLHVKMSDRRAAANRALAVWAKLFSWAIERHLVPEGHNPATRITKYIEEKRERFLTTMELARLGEALRDAESVGIPYAVNENGPKAKHAPKPENRLTKFDPAAVAAIRLLLFTGCRLREILHLRWSEVDAERGMLFLGDSKTGKKTVVLNAPALAVLAQLPRINDYVVPGGKPDAPRADLKRIWDAVIARAELSGVRIHDLRHTFASYGAGASLGLPIVGKLLGHSQPQTTARYAHLDADPVRRASNTIGATIAAALGDTPNSRFATPITRLAK